MIDRDGFFTWEDRHIYDGILQASSESQLRYRLLRNCNLFERDALRKDLGIRKIHQTTLGSGRPSYAGFDAHFNNGTQKLVVVNETSASTTDTFAYNTATGEFDADSQTLAAAEPDMIMFANKLILMNGTQFRSMTSAGTWTAVTGSPPAAKFATIHAERMIMAGIAGDEHSIHVSGIRDETDHDATLALVLTAPRGEEVKSLGRLGPLMIAQTRTSTHAYQLSTDNPRDWDRSDISSSVGNVHHGAFVELEQGRGEKTRALAFFWSAEGPFVLARLSQGPPALYPLWEPVERALKEQEYQNMPAIDIGRFNNVRGTWVPEYGEVRFACSKSGSTENDMQLCFDVDSVFAYVTGQSKYPYIRIRDNVNLGYFPGDSLFTARLDADGKPSPTGRVRGLAMRDGVVHELDAPNTWDDLGEDIPFFASRSGYDGKQDGVQAHVKVAQHVPLRATQVGDGVLYVSVIGDGGRTTGTDELSLDEGLTKWDQSTWDGGKWNDGEFRDLRADFGVHGQRFEIQLYDNGNISEDFQLDSWALSGMVEDRR